jgi:hypothetical protein
MDEPLKSPIGDDMIEIGPDQYYSKLFSSKGEWVGIYEWHKCVAAQNAGDDQLSAGGVLFEGYPEYEAGGPRWTVESLDPLTLSPSIRCLACDNHGFIRGGRWQGA